MTTSAEILDALERRAEKFEFPVLDNANAQLIAGRFRGVRRAEEWGLLFEILVFAPQERAIVTDVYAYGSLLGDREWALFQVGGIDEVRDMPLWDENGNWRSNAGVRVVSVAGQRLQVSCGSLAAGTIVLDGPDCLNEVRFTRALIQRVGFDKLVPRHVVFDYVPGFALGEEAVSLTNWDHPDVAAGETPRDSCAIVAVARLLAGEVDSVEYDHSRDNLYAPRWTNGV